MEHKIGEIFEYNGEWYQCIRSILTCSSCEIPRPCTKIRELGYCSPNMRNDKEQVVFKKLEKVGESYTHYCPSGRIIYFQRYKLFYKLYSHNTEYIMCDFNEDGIVSIEIKQNKEDMEEKKIQHYDCFFDKEQSKPNLKPFSLEMAKQGKPVCTRDGRKARIICFDMKCLDEQVLIVLVDCGKEESIYFYTTDGKCIDDFSSFDLMMLPEKKEGWVNVYNSLGVVTFSNNPYDTKEEALEELKSASGRAYCVDTIKVNWEE